jgi:lipopolysaccharide/colanic/teichoic acid biosynthesis glycosyltransferase
MERCHGDSAQRAKRVLDLVGAAILLLLTLPLLAVVGLAIIRRSPGPVLYRQPREGWQGVPFTMIKLRTMRLEADRLLARRLAESPAAREEWGRYRRLANDLRIIPGLGRWVRRYSVDELPQLWNVVRGDMSLVGPRPLELPVAQTLPGDLRAMRSTVRPGMTGLWQVRGRSDVDIQTMIRLDVEYVRCRSLWKDAAILWQTLGVVWSGRGAY